MQKVMKVRGKAEAAESLLKAELLRDVKVGNYVQSKIRRLEHNQWRVKQVAPTPGGEGGALRGGSSKALIGKAQFPMSLCSIFRFINHEYLSKILFAVNWELREYSFGLGP